MFIQFIRCLFDPFVLAPNFLNVGGASIVTRISYPTMQYMCYKTILNFAMFVIDNVATLTCKTNIC